MIREFGLLLIAMTISGSALAQTLQCSTFTSQDPNGVYGGSKEVIVPIPSPDYQITGAGCEFRVWKGNPGQYDPNARAIIEGEQWISNAGYACKARGPETNSYVLTTATIFACRIVIEQDLFRTSSKWATTTDGVSLVVARNASGFDKPIPFDIRICSNRRNSPVGLYVFAVDPTNSGPGKRTDITLEAGHCLPTVKDANIVLIHNSGQLPQAFGHYRMQEFKAQSGTLAAPKLGQRETITAKCEDFPQPLQDKAFYARSCNAPRLAELKNARVCFADGWSNLPPSLGQPDYPPALLPMVLDKNLNKPDANLMPDAGKMAYGNFRAP